MNIEDLLVAFDEMSFTPMTLCSNPEEYARAWKRQLIREIERLEAETGKEFTEKLKGYAERCYKWDIAKIVCAEVDNVLEGMKNDRTRSN